MWKAARLDWIRLDLGRSKVTYSVFLPWRSSPPALLTHSQVFPCAGLLYYTLHTTQYYTILFVVSSDSRQFLPSRAGAQQKNLPRRRRITEDDWFKDGNDEEGKELKSWGFKFLEEKTYTYPISKKAH